MRAITTYDEPALEVLNNIPLFVLEQGCISGNVSLEINNGKITSATQTHRDYVWFKEPRNSYI
jgi:hypothetical protein